MSAVREIVLEVKRRLGDVNTPVPSEVDVVAAMNRVLLGLFNYGVLVRADVLQKSTVFTINADSRADFPDGAAAVLAAVDCGSGRELVAVSPLEGARMNALNYGGAYGYLADGRGVTVYPLGSSATEVLAVYIPAFKRVTARSDETPFCPALENAVIEGTVRLLRGEVQSIADTEFVASMPFGNMVMQYFRGIAHTDICGRAPW
ncbi:hypothetical protein [Cloacibacillus evryensis]|uniref:hypothetical protein n=1 Tax=Cloacibacillus evryensis TaxID=508460 RepID=UPI00241E6CB4|nr:hypothetical protein [Cloacibacillus evryensis]